MRFALDLVFLDTDGRAVEIRAGVPPGRVARCRRAVALAESNAGEGAAFARALARVK
jgi:uncharacterized membrane protein (UPF0127 family)